VDYPCGKFGDCRFGFIVQSNRQTYTDDDAKRLTAVTVIDMNNKQ